MEMQAVSSSTSMSQKKVVNNSFYDAEGYRASIRRQNRFVSATMLVIAGMFIAAYFIMGLSFTPSNIGIFGPSLYLIKWKSMTMWASILGWRTIIGGRTMRRI